MEIFAVTESYEAPEAYFSTREGAEAYIAAAHNAGRLFIETHTLN